MSIGMALYGAFACACLAWALAHLVRDLRRAGAAGRATAMRELRALGLDEDVIEAVERGGRGPRR